MTDLHELEPKRSAILNQELTIIKEATREVATPDEARHILGLN